MSLKVSKVVPRTTRVSTPDSLTKNLLPRLQSRRQYFDYLDGWTVGPVEGPRTRRTTRAVTKAFLLETSPTSSVGDVQTAFSEGSQIVLEPVDEELFRMRWADEAEDWALLEVDNNRYPVIYTAIESDIANRRVDQLVNQSSLLDRTWLSPSMFQQLWNLVEKTFPRNRFSRIVFEHESVFQRFEDDPHEQSEEDDDFDEELTNVERAHQTDRRRARVQITERIGEMQDAVLPWEKHYDPLASIIQLRIPAQARGGHDVYFDGRFTNRSDSTTAFRQTVRDVMKKYDSATHRVEDAAWPGMADGQVGLRLGAPLLIQFSEPLEPGAFNRWIATLSRKTNRFRLWGTPLTRGPGKVHLYAVDNHLWQPLDLEITRNHVYALLPKGTCGNSVHRLVTNIQRFVQPKVSVFIGEHSYEGFLKDDLNGDAKSHG